jgi:Tfp pilus assembly protein PilN
MKEIDFLPGWYKSGRRRQISYRTQYVALGGLFLLVVAWSLVSARTVSKATADLAHMASGQSQAQEVFREFTEVKSKLEKLQEKVRVIEGIDSQIDVASTLAEISYLIDEKVVLSKVDFSAERFAEDSKRPPTSGSVVRVAGATPGAAQLPVGKVRFKVVINGIASDPSDVAELICRLENSPYFCLVYPSFSRNKTIDAFGGSGTNREMQRAGTPSQAQAAGLAPKKYQVSEFEISCYLANYRQEES